MKLNLIQEAADLQDKTVIVRVDYNVPLKEQDGQMVVRNDKRIQDSVKTINFLRENNCRIILISHLGRPGGEAKPELSLAPVAKHLTEKLNLATKFSPDVVSDKNKSLIEELRPGEILLLENLRFKPGEKKNNPQLAEQLASYADIYVNEAFSTSHRAHASMVGISKHIPAYAGFHVQQEVNQLSKLLEEPETPFVMVIGGAKISDKVEAVKNLDQVASLVLVGGGVANNFLKAGGLETHKSYLEDKPADEKKEGVDYVKVAGELIEENKTEKILKDGYIPLPKILYPIDVKAAENPESDVAEIINLSTGMEDTPEDKDMMYLDLGPRTIRLYQEMILQARTIFWNGPMGVFENDEFAEGTEAIARAIAKSGAKTILGGGDTIAAIKKFELEDRYDYVSSAGGASLDFLAGKELPGLKVLTITE